LAQLAATQLGDRRAVDGDGAAVRLLEPVDRADERRLAGTGLPDDAVDLALLDVRGDVVERADVASRGAEGLGHIHEVDHGASWARAGLRRVGHRQASGAGPRGVPPERQRPQHTDVTFPAPPPRLRAALAPELGSPFSITARPERSTPAPDLALVDHRSPTVSGGG